MMVVEVVMCELCRPAPEKDDISRANMFYLLSNQHIMLLLERNPSNAGQTLGVLNVNRLFFGQ